MTKEAGEQGAREKDTGVLLPQGFQAPKFIYTPSKNIYFDSAGGKRVRERRREARSPLASRREK